MITGFFCNENREKIPASTTARIESDHLGNDRSGVFNRRRGVVLISRQGSVFVNNSNKGADSETNGQDKKPTVKIERKPENGPERASKSGRN